MIWLLRKDARELAASRSFWLLLAASGLLAGHAFSTSVATYAEMSGASGGPAALRSGLNPLDGIVVPTMGVLWLVATLLLPFIVIRMIAHERENGSWKLLVQGPASLGSLIASKLLVLVIAWLAACVPIAVALMMWRASGNHLYAPELLSAMLGHFLFAWLTIGVAACAAAMSTSEASAAIVTLGFTIGTWALDFMGAARGGTAARLAAFTPTSVLRSFERGLIRVDAMIVMIAIGVAGIVIASVWLQLRNRLRRKILFTAGVAAVLVVVVFAASALRGGWSALRGAYDVSEDRRNSFSVADERALRTITEPLRVEVHLAAEDPRLVDLRLNVLDKLERVLPSLEVVNLGGSGTGLFAKPGSGYGETWYILGGRREMTHSTAEPIVLEVLYHLAGITPPSDTGTPDASGAFAIAGGYPGYPLVRKPAGIELLFYVIWPLLAAMLYWLLRARRPGNQE
jgi:hypothetical protein